MIFFVFFFCLVIIGPLAVVHACDEIQITSNTLGHLIFRPLKSSEALDAGFFTNGRGVYHTSIMNQQQDQQENENKELFLYHILAPPYEEGLGRWVINDVLGADDSAITYVDSWSVMPHLVAAVNDPTKSNWMISTENGWDADPSFTIHCVSHDHTFFLTTEGFASYLSGFYIQIGTEEATNSPIFLKVRTDDRPHIYFYKRNKSWILGEELDSDVGLGFVFDDAIAPSRIASDDWRFSSNGNWHKIPTFIISGIENQDVYSALRVARSTSFPAEQKFYQLRNGIVMPAVGLGTGGIPPDIVQEVMLDSYKMGYRLFDLAREYYNENDMGRLLTRQIPRSDVFIISKVWPTHLGFKETLKEISLSTLELQTTYIDMYLLHWPTCDSRIEWMHCEETENVDGTWKQSWRALEKAYAEGRVLSIGVSNFDPELLQEIDDFALVTPHAVQNHAKLTYHDIESRIWCAERSAIFIPYATGRNLYDLPADIIIRVKILAEKYHISNHALVSLFFLTSGTAIIPRSTNSEHLQENINISFLPFLSDEELSYLGWNYGNEHVEL